MGRVGRDSSRVVRAALAAVCVVAAALIAGGCGDSADSANAKGQVTLGFMTFRDQTGFDAKLFRRCEKKDGNAYRINAIPMGPTVDAAREQLSRRLAAKDQSIDMINLDVIWTAEFSDAGWIMDLSSRVRPIKDQYVPAALESTYYKGKYWALPIGTNPAFLYYRTDLVKTPPTTYEQVAKDVKDVHASNPDIGGFVFQGGSYEGGTVDATEFLLSHGASIISDDGRTATIADGDNAKQTFEWLQSVMKDNVAPRVITTYNEEDARLAFQTGHAVFMRNWPYAVNLMNSDPSSKVKGKFDVVALPGFEGHTGASVLGGQNYGIANTSKHADLAWKAMVCLSDDWTQRQKALVKGEMPTFTRMYQDPVLKQKIPYLDTLWDGLRAGVNRPTTPYYNDVTVVINSTYNDVLNNRISPSDAVQQMQTGIQHALDGKADI